VSWSGGQGSDLRRTIFLLDHGRVALGEALNPHLSVLESPHVMLFEQDAADEADGRPDSVLPDGKL
jgi:hypothetical protein